MSGADDRISLTRLVTVIGGPDGPLPAIAGRLRGYELDGIVMPEIRKEQVCPPLNLTAGAISVPNLIGGQGTSSRPHDFHYEALRTRGLPPLNPAPAMPLHEVRYYSPDDAKAIARHERPLAALRPDFCRFAWGSEVDPEAVQATEPSKPAQEEPCTTATLYRRLVGSGFVTKDGARVKWRTVVENKQMVAAARVGSPEPGESGKWDRARFESKAQDQGYEFDFAPATVQRAKKPSSVPGNAMGGNAAAPKGR